MKILLSQVFSIIILCLVTKHTDSSKKTYNFFDWNRDYTNLLRGVAILFVVLHHVANIYGIRYFTPLGGVGVAMFLILSGYGLSESFSKKKLDNFWRNKFFKVLIPCWIVDILFSIINFKQLSLSTFIGNMLCININWYIRYLFYWYFIFFVVQKFFHGNIYIYIAISIVMLIGLPGIEAEQSLSFFSGILISRRMKTIKSVFDKRCIAYLNIISLFLVGLFMLALKQNPIIRELEGSIIYNVIQLILKLTLGLGLCIVLCRLNKYINTKFLLWTGLMSYEIYLVHCNMLFFVRFDNQWLGIILFYIMTIIGSYFLYTISNKINSLILK